MWIGVTNNQGFLTYAQTTTFKFIHPIIRRNDTTNISNGLHWMKQGVKGFLDQMERTKGKHYNEIDWIGKDYTLFKGVFTILALS